MHGGAQPSGAPRCPAGACRCSELKFAVNMPGKFELLLDDLRTGEIAGISAGISATTNAIDSLSAHVDASVSFTEQRMASVDEKLAVITNQVADLVAMILKMQGRTVVPSPERLDALVPRPSGPDHFEICSDFDAEFTELEDGEQSIAQYCSSCHAVLSRDSPAMTPVQLHKKEPAPRPPEEDTPSTACPHSPEGGDLNDFVDDTTRQLMQDFDAATTDAPDVNVQNDGPFDGSDAARMPIPRFLGCSAVYKPLEPISEIPEEPEEEVNAHDTPPEEIHKGSKVDLITDFIVSLPAADDFGEIEQDHIFSYLLKIKAESLPARILKWKGMSASRIASEAMYWDKLTEDTRSAMALGDTRPMKQIYMELRSQRDFPWL